MREKKRNENFNKNKHGKQDERGVGRERAKAHEVKNRNESMEVELYITDFTDMGQGIGKMTEENAAEHRELAGLTIFVSGAYPKDRVRASIVKIKKNYAIAETLEIIEESPHREKEFCPHADECGGCTFCGYSYEGELAIKSKQVRDKLERLGGLEAPTVRDIISIGTTSVRPTAYRNKAEFAVGIDGSVGFYGSKSHRVFDCRECKLQMPSAMAAAAALRKYIAEVKPFIYDRKRGKGLLRGMVVKTAAGTGEVMVIIVATAVELPQAQLLADLMDEYIFEVGFELKSLIVNVNKTKESTVLGEKCVTLAGKPTILERSGELCFEISPLAFYQVNPAGMEKLYGKVMEYAGLTGNETVFDLYCGVGTIGIFAAREMQRKAEEKSVALEMQREAAEKSAVQETQREAAKKSAALVNMEKDVAGSGGVEAKRDLQLADIKSVSMAKAMAGTGGATEDEAKRGLREACAGTEYFGTETVGAVSDKGADGIESADKAPVRTMIGEALVNAEKDVVGSSGVEAKRDLQLADIKSVSMAKAMAGTGGATEDEAKRGLREACAGTVYGIESVKGAVLDANRNAVINGIVNVRYFSGKAETEIFKLTEGFTDRFGEELSPVSPDVIIVDPPRAGCDSTLLYAAAKAAPKRIIYVSCDSGTLARDIKLLSQLGYAFEEATPVDMFSGTGHVETVVLLSKVQN